MSYFKSALDKRLLMRLQRKAIRYFLENQLEHGLILDRQDNKGPLRMDGLCSTSATGMGLIAIALAAAPEYRMISQKQARLRLGRALDAAFSLPHDHGIMPHFTTGDGITPVGSDRLATVDSAWLIAGALLASQFPWMQEHRKSANALFNRVDWKYWTIRARFADLSRQPGDMNDTLKARKDGDWLLHGQRDDGTFLPSHWDLLNAETAFMYVLAAGSPGGRRVSPCIFKLLSDLLSSSTTSQGFGLFVHQYSLEIIDFSKLPLPGNLNLQTLCRHGVLANYRKCAAEAPRFKTFRKFWGLSAGDGPPDVSGGEDQYRPYGLEEPPLIDGTAHVMATLASVRLAPKQVGQNMLAARSVPGMNGRYGYSNVNLDRNWLSRDVVGIDVGAAVMAIDNFFHDNRLPRIFHCVPAVRRTIDRLTKAG